jgi:hypothetical protein
MAVCHFGLAGQLMRQKENPSYHVGPGATEAFILMMPESGMLRTLKLRPEMGRYLVVTMRMDSDDIPFFDQVPGELVSETPIEIWVARNEKSHFTVTNTSSMSVEFNGKLEIDVELTPEEDMPADGNEP